MDRHDTFGELHGAGCFVMPNPWDVGSARVMAAMGAKALATSSAAHAFTLGRPDMGGVTRDEALAHAEELVAATPLPVSGDFENGFADAPDDVAETLRLAGEVGLSGCSIEDTQMAPGNPAYAFDLAVERIEAAVAAGRAMGRPFVLTARADGVMNGVYDIAEGIRRLQAFEAAGADCLYLPVPPDVEGLRAVLAAVSAPVNALAAGALARTDIATLAGLGVRRISLGSMPARVTHAALMNAMAGIYQRGTFDGLAGAAPGAEVDALLGKGGGAAN
ncbi:MAG: isocitrate lyase/phosphoenolpyruvate mutase family protein [Pseudomonadota bacterium]